MLPITQNQTTKKKVPVERQKGNNKWSALFAFEAECRDKPNEWQVKVLDPAHFLLDVCPQSKIVLTMALAPAFRSYKILFFTLWFLPGSYATSSCRTLMLYNFTPCVSSSSSCNICNTVCNFECCGMFWHCVPTKAPPYQSRVKGRLSTPRNKLAYCVLERLNCFIRWVPQWNSMEPLSPNGVCIGDKENTSKPRISRSLSGLICKAKHFCWSSSKSSWNIWNIQKNENNC